ncbi:MAG: DUF367 family protein [Thermoplasmata archaeon]|nr:DUF367 family protein [Thermoplasmata archaeon]
MIKLFVIYLADDDPKKCTAKKMERFGLAKLIKRKTHTGGIILSPLSDIVISKEDYNEAIMHGLYAVDGSWKNIDSIFSNIKGEFRRLPFLIPGNPVNFGHPNKLSTAEALSAALYILGEVDQANMIIGKFSWGHTFIETNMELLNSYKNADRKEIEKIEKEFQQF